MILFFPLPKPESVLQTDPERVITSLLLMKLGGQVSVSIPDLKTLAQEYAGYFMSFDIDTESLTIKLMTRPEDEPEPKFIPIA